MTFKKAKEQVYSIRGGLQQPPQVQSGDSWGTTTEEV